MRLFVALDPSAAAVGALDAALAPLRAGWPQLRWSPVQQWHLTLAFLGEVPERRVEPLADRLARAAARAQPLSLRLTGAGTFPRQPAKARVLWAGVEGDVDATTRLAARCAAAARRTGIEVTDQPYRPHVTLARPRRPPADLTALTDRLSSYAGVGWTVRSVRLVRSHLGPETTHETLLAWPLGPAELPPGAAGHQA